MDGSLTHFDEEGASRMVDISAKEVTRREARATGQVEMAAETLARILDKQLSKGDVLEVARLAGIMAAKRTSDLIPLCHPIAITSVEVGWTQVSPTQLRAEVTCRIDAKTGVEMEALTAASVACLTVYDMCKSIDRGMKITCIQLEHKSGGASGRFDRA